MMKIRIGTVTGAHQINDTRFVSTGSETGGDTFFFGFSNVLKGKGAARTYPVNTSENAQ